MCEQLAEATSYLHMQTVLIKGASDPLSALEIKFVSIPAFPFSPECCLDLGARSVFVQQSGQLKLCLCGTLIHRSFPPLG